MAKQPTHSRGEGSIKLTDIDASDRLRELTPDVMKYIEESLAPSIADHGLIQPIVIDDNKKLVAGGCRYTAFKLLQYEKIPYVTRSKLSPAEAILLELEENFRRLKMRWQEATLGIYKAHKLKKAEASKMQAKWGVRQTGALLGVSHATVGDALLVAEHLIKADKEILEALSFDKAQNILASRKQDAAMRELATRSASPIIISTAAAPPRKSSGPVDPESPVFGQNSGQNEIDQIAQGEPRRTAVVDLQKMLYHQDCHEWFLQREAESVDHIFTDIPYGIDMDNIESLDGLDMTRDEHDVEENIAQMEPFLQSAWKVLREHAYCCFYCAPEHVNYLRDIAQKIGFGVQKWPNLWVKTHGVKNKHPHRTFGKSYDPIMVMWKGQPSLVTTRNRCDYSADGMMEKRMMKHPFSKPFEVNKWMLESIARPGQVVLDPYAGCGSIARCGISLGLQMISVEKKEQHMAYLKDTYVKTYRQMLGENTQFIGG